MQVTNWGNGEAAVVTRAPPPSFFLARPPSASWLEGFMLPSAKAVPLRNGVAVATVHGNDVPVRVLPPCKSRCHLYDGENAVGTSQHSLSFTPVFGAEFRVINRIFGAEFANYFAFSAPIL